MGWKRWLIPLSVLPVLALLAYGLMRGPPGGAPSKLVGKTAPGFALETLEGDTLRLADVVEESPVVLNFWASWCVPCLHEHPLLVEASRRYGPRGLELVGVVYQDRRENAIRWLERMGGEWPNVVDPGSRTAIAYGVSGVPETYFIARGGRVLYKQIGPVSRGVLEEWAPKLVTGEGVEAGGVGRSAGHVKPGGDFPEDTTGTAGGGGGAP